MTKALNSDQHKTLSIWDYHTLKIISVKNIGKVQMR